MAKYKQKKKIVPKMLKSVKYGITTIEKISPMFVCSILPLLFPAAMSLTASFLSTFFPPILLLLFSFFQPFSVRSSPLLSPHGPSRPPSLLPRQTRASPSPRIHQLPSAAQYELHFGGKSCANVNFSPSFLPESRYRSAHHLPPSWVLTGELSLWFFLRLIL